MLWVFLPTLLLLMNIGIGFSRPSLFTPYLPYLAITTAAASFRFKGLGLIGSYLLLALFILLFLPHISSVERFWQIGIFLSHALTLYVVVLIAEEIEGCIQLLEQELRKEKHVAVHMEEKLLHALKSMDEKEKEFAEEIQKLKEEAAQRKVERAADVKRLHLIQSEIELLTAQKENFIEKARLARESSLNYLKECEALKEKEVRWTHLESEIAKLRQENNCVQQSLGSAQEKNAQLLQQLETEKEEFHTTTCVLKQHLEEAHHLKNSNRALSQEIEKGEEKMRELSEQLKLEMEQQQRVQLWHKEQIDQMQEGILRIQACHPTTESPIPTGQLQQAVARAEGLYHQFRAQFDEKNQMLSDTRKELFNLEGNSVCREMEAEAAQLEEGNQIAATIEALGFEAAQLEEEVTHLEELISHILSL